jgi:trimethylamine--corrinoid protein Co-methyltransferase
MSTMVGQLAAPEIRGFNEDLLHHYGLPAFGNGAVSGAKTVDCQAAFEAALTLLTAVQSGSQLIHDVGYMDNGATGSLEQLVICHEMIGWIKAYTQPLCVNDETLALDEVRAVTASEGHFLGSDNTLHHFREDYYPSLTDRQSYYRWEKEGGISFQERARKRVAELLEPAPRDRLTSEQNAALQAIVESPS